ncbi:FecR family protein [Kiloniella majae]|uniref:FecR family protein n=1 Tax=Kiloniella majae TaxID=1938558 RepID=UPI000A27948B|nr:FecR domain-containing protein [Kiloniella majae]
MTNELLIPKRASEWIVLLNDDPENLTLQQDFQLWLESDVKHQEDWEVVSRTWHLLGHVGPALSVPSVRSQKSHKIPEPDLFLDQGVAEKSSSFSSVYLPLSAKSCLTRGVVHVTAFMILFLVIGFSGPKFKYLGADYVNSNSEALVLNLDDGSRITLAPETALDVVFSRKERKVTIVSGAAFFEVSKDTTRPFVVNKKNIQTKVLGTAFLVDEQEAGIRVAVTEGLVQVNHMHRGSVSVQLRPGERIEFLDTEGYKLSKSPVGDIASWREGYLKVRDQSLNSVVSQIDRFFNGHIFIQDADIRERRLTGVFKLSQPRKSLRGIASLHGLEVTEISPWIIILSKK